MRNAPAHFLRSRAWWVAATAATALCGCETPFDQQGEDQLRAAIDAAVARQGAGPGPEPGSQGLQQVSSVPSDVMKALGPRIPELDALGPQSAAAGPALGLGLDVTDGSVPIQISLQSAMAAAVRNNLGAQGARISQAVSEADLVVAEAAFDAVLTSGISYNDAENPAPPIDFGGIGNAIAQQFKETTLSTGIQKRMASGGTVGASLSANYIQQQQKQIYDPDNYWQPALAVQLNQPLLRGFGSDVNLAQVRIARNNDRAALLNLRRTLLNLVRDVEQQYWAVVQTRQNVVAQAWLVKVGEDVRDILAKRREFDATVADYALAVAIVEQRRSQLIRAQLAARNASDRLKLTMNDPGVPVGGDTTLIPIDRMAESPIRYSLRDAVVTAVEQSPVVATAVLDIDNASIMQVVADNGRMPQLDLNAQVQMQGQDANFGNSMSELGGGSFVSYLAGLAFSQPLGNRAGEAEYRKARLQRSGAVIAYEQSIENVVFTVKTALRTVVASHQLIEQTRASRLAAAESLRALQVLEQTLAALTPEFLQTKFVAQERLALAYAAEIDALVNYNVSIAELYNAMGTGLQMNRIELQVVDPAG
jgi:outer membrane protein